MRLHSFFSPVSQSPSFLHIIWRGEGDDPLFMHQFNEFGQITEFFPVSLDQLAGFGTLVKKPKGMTKAAQVGDMSPIAFHFPNGDVDCGLPKRMKLRLKGVMDQLQDRPLLAVDVMAFVDPGNETELNRLLDQGAAYLRESYSDEMADDWLRDEKANLNWLRQIPVLGKPSGTLGATIIDLDYLDGLLSVTAEKKRDYLRGGLPDFAIVNEGVPVTLGVVAKGVDLLQRHRTLLLEGPAGTGKTTALMQIGLDLLRRNPEARVFWIDPLQIDPLTFSPKGKGPLVLLVDRADQWSNLPRFLEQCQRKNSDILVVLAARSNEWNRAWRRIDFSRFGLQKLSLARLDDGLWESLAKRIVDHGAADDGVGVAEIVQRFSQGKAKDLLAAMILATRGQSFQEILRDLVARLADFPDGRKLMAMLAAVAGMETRRDPKGRTHPATLPLLRETFRFSREGLNFAMSNLKGELTLVHRDRRVGGRGQFLFQEVHTRHPVIAETLWAIFSQGVGVPIDLVKLDIALFKGAATVSDMGREPTPERVFTSTLLETRAKEGPVDAARRLFSLIPEYSSSDSYLWQIWGRFEKNQGNVGSLEEENTARWLFSRAVAVDSKNVQAWQAWAVLEAREGNVGSLEAKNTARWLFSQAVAVDSKNAPSLQAWAMLEAREGNVGSLEEKHTARWLFSQSVAADSKHAPAWQAWAVMEAREGNIGSLEAKNTARWLFSHAVAADSKDAQSWQAWAVMESGEKNVGSLEEKHTARWLFSQAVAADSKNAQSWQAWAVMEAGEKNVGSLEEKHTARWLFSQSVAADSKHAQSWQAWAVMEGKLGNHGGPNVAYSAVWLNERLRQCS